MRLYCTVKAFAAVLRIALHFRTHTHPFLTPLSQHSNNYLTRNSKTIQTRQDAKFATMPRQEKRVYMFAEGRIDQKELLGNKGANLCK